MKHRIRTFLKGAVERDRFVENYKNAVVLHNKLMMQLSTAGAFFLLSITNIFTKSYFMLGCTALGCVLNIMFAILAKKLKSGNLCAASAIATCSVLFGFFVLFGGNDGFACLWVALLPFLSMVAMSFQIGFFASMFFQVFLFIVFWTPVREMLPYHYNDQFCLRFPLFFLVTFILGFLAIVSLRKSEYNECQHLLEMEKLTASAQNMARTDPLTKLANRRFAYEEFDKRYTADGVPHCVVMGDIDNFKKINDCYGHEFGDSVLEVFAEYFNRLLPPDYLKSRWGGEEFLFAANAPLNEVYAQVEGLRKAIAGHTFGGGRTPLHITITFGIAEYANKEDLIKAISRADLRLYNGKKTSKNRTVIDDRVNSI